MTTGAVGMLEYTLDVVKQEPLEKKEGNKQRRRDMTAAEESGMFG